MQKDDVRMFINSLKEMRKYIKCEFVSMLAYHVVSTWIKMKN